MRRHKRSLCFGLTSQKLELELGIYDTLLDLEFMILKETFSRKLDSSDFKSGLPISLMSSHIYELIGLEKIRKYRFTSVHTSSLSRVSSE